MDDSHLPPSQFPPPSAALPPMHPPPGGPAAVFAHPNLPPFAHMPYPFHQPHLSPSPDHPAALASLPAPPAQSLPPPHLSDPRSHLDDSQPPRDPANVIDTSDSASSRMLYGPPDGALATSYVGSYTLYGTIGEGAFGKVKIAVDRRSNVRVAIKIMDKSEIREQEFTAQVRREIYIMRCLKHRHIVRMHEVLTSDTKLYIVMELVTGGELFERIEKGPVKEDAARQYFQQLVDGVDFCHKKGVAHRDLKPENLLLDDNGEIKITDFGFSSMKGMDVNTGLLYTQCGTPDYCAPEIIDISKDGYTGAKVDAWSCGIILYALLCGRLPFQESDVEKLYDLILACKVRYPDYISRGARELLENLLVRDPDHRFDLHKVKRHPWFLVNYEGDDARFLKRRPFYNNKKDASSGPPSGPSSPTAATSSDALPTPELPAPQTATPSRAPVPTSAPPPPALVPTSSQVPTPTSGQVSTALPEPPPPQSPPHLSAQYMSSPQSAQSQSSVARSRSSRATPQPSGSVPQCAPSDFPSASTGPAPSSPFNTDNEHSSLSDALPFRRGSGSVPSRPSPPRLHPAPGPPRNTGASSFTSREDPYAALRPSMPPIDFALHPVRGSPPAVQDVFTKVEDRPATPARRQLSASTAAAIKAAAVAAASPSAETNTQPPQLQQYPTFPIAPKVSSSYSSSHSTMANGVSSPLDTAGFSASGDGGARGDDSSSEPDSVEDYENKPAVRLDLPANPRRVLRMNEESRKKLPPLPQGKQLRQRSDLTHGSTANIPSSSGPASLPIVGNAHSLGALNSNPEEGYASLSSFHHPRRTFMREGSSSGAVPDGRVRLRTDTPGSPPVTYSPTVNGAYERMRSISPGFGSMRAAGAAPENSNAPYGSGSGATNMPWHTHGSYGYSAPREEPNGGAGGWHTELFSRHLWNMVCKLRGTNDPASPKVSRELRKDLQVLVGELSQLNKVDDVLTIFYNFLTLFENYGLSEMPTTSPGFGRSLSADDDYEGVAPESRGDGNTANGEPRQPPVRLNGTDISSEEEPLSLSPVVADSSGPQLSDLARRRNLSDLLTKWIKSTDQKLEEAADADDPSQVLDVAELQRLLREQQGGREESNLADDLLRFMNGAEDGQGAMYSSIGNQSGQSPMGQAGRIGDSFGQTRYLSTNSASGLISSAHGSASNNSLARPSSSIRSSSKNGASLPSEYVPGRLSEPNGLSPRRRVNDRQSTPPGRSNDEEGDTKTVGPERESGATMANSMGMHDVPYYMSDKKGGMANKLLGVLQTMKAKNHRLGETHAQFKSSLPADEIMRLLGRVLQGMGATVTIKRETKRKMKCQLEVKPNNLLHAGIELSSAEDRMTTVSFKRSRADKGRTDTESFHNFFEEVREQFINEANAQFPSLRMTTAGASASRRRRARENGSRHFSETGQSSVSGG